MMRNDQRPPLAESLVDLAVEEFNGRVVRDPWAEGLDGARELATLGVHVVALHALDWPEGATKPRGCTCSLVTCTAPANHPRDADWEAHATTNRTDLEFQFRLPSNPAIALARSGLCALEVDPRDGFPRLARLKKKHGPMPGTVFIEASPTGRRWYLFQLLEPVERRQLPRYPGLYLHSAGAWIPAPPSENTRDGIHRWGARGPIAPIPDWLHAMVVPK